MAAKQSRSSSDVVMQERSSANGAVPHFSTFANLQRMEPGQSPSPRPAARSGSATASRLSKLSSSDTQSPASSPGKSPGRGGRSSRSFSGARSASPPRSRNQQGSPPSSPGSPRSLQEALGTGSGRQPPMRVYSTYMNHLHSSDQLPAEDEEMYQPRTNAVFHRPSSIQRVGGDAVIVEFSDWAQSMQDGWAQIHQMFMKEDSNPSGEVYAEHGSKGMRGISKSRWVRLLENKGFRSELAAVAVFDEVSKEIRTDKKAKLDLFDEPQEPTITLAQFKRFELRCVSVTATLASSNPQSPTARLIKFLNQHRGSTLRAWRADLDKRSAGRVAFVDFCNACRSLGFPSQGKLIWYNLRQDKVTPLDFHELDPKEGKNLEDFAEILWERIGLDLAKAWQFLDTNHQNYLTYEEFKAGATELGFEGDAKLLFKGLDSTGLGRLKQSDFEYIGQISKTAHKKLGGCIQMKSAVAELIAWVKREMGDAELLIRKLGLGAGPTEQICVGDLSARLTALGFEGDALGVASKASRAEGGTQITAESLYSLLCGGKCKAGHHHGSPPGSPAASKPRSTRAPPTPIKGVWCDAVDNMSEQNTHKCRHARGYFSASPKLEEKSTLVTMHNGGASTNKPSRASRNVVARPAWEDSFGPQVQASSKKCYFSDPAEKPVRDERRTLLEQKRRANAARTGMAN